jgi:DNA-binding LacI/PurR family transcriptional regulator
MLDRSYTYADYSDFSSFANSRSHAIALMVSDIRNPFLHRNFAAIEERLAGEGFDPLLGYSLGLQTGAATVTVHALLQNGRPTAAALLLTR